MCLIQSYCYQVRSYQEERIEERNKTKTESTPRRHDDIPRKIIPEPVPETDSWKPDPDTIRVVKSQDSPAKRLRQEAEPLKRAKGVGDSPRLTQASHQPRPDHYKSSPNVASRHKTGMLTLYFGLKFSFSKLTLKSNQPPTVIPYGTMPQGHKLQGPDIFLST